jgi:hypothetical protein
MLELSLLVVLAGCGGAKLSPVHGKVTLADGSPAPNATVTFENVETHVRATGTTDDAGAYELSMLSKGDGIPPGEYKIAVFQAGAADSSATKAPPRIFPVRYESAETSGLTYTVTPGANTHDIPLEGT